MNTSANTSSSVDLTSDDALAAKKQVMLEIKEAYLNTQANQSREDGWEVLPDEVSEVSMRVKAALRTICNKTNVLDVSGTFIGLKAYADKDDSQLDAEDRELLKTIKPAIEKFEVAVDHLYNLTLENFDEEIQEFRASARLMEKISNILFRD
ncbi:hypothetical protein DID74_00480 [Candidatus Marinamargulisbacteria bacterium SCGC AG-333-B06]|nr:hypothetical protein DID74_00480 [Candidatus Marinamargulisbacteria bacterium SCGC AG-333-B06]